MTEPSEWCLMEYVSVLAGEPPTDRPLATHPWLAALGRWVHDRVGPGARRELRLLAPAMVGLDGPDDAVRAAVVDACARLGGELCPDSTLFARLRRGTGRPRRLVELGALVVDVCRAAAVLEPAAHDEVLTGLLAEIIEAVETVGAAPARTAGSTPGHAATLVGAAT